MLSMIIKNKGELLSHGNKKGREIVLDIIENAIKAVDAYEATKRKVHIEDDKLIIENLIYDLSNIRDIYIIGAGKASFSIAQALDEILGNRIKEGIVIVKRGENRRLKHIEVIEASHPVPDERG